MVIKRRTHQCSMACPSFWYMQHMQKLSVVLHIFHVSVWGINKYVDIRLNPAFPGVWDNDHKMAILESVLWHKTYLQMCVSYHFYLRHDAFGQSNFIFLSHFLYLPWSITPFLYVDSEKYFGNSHTRLMSNFWVCVCM